MDSSPVPVSVRTAVSIGLLACLLLLPGCGAEQDRTVLRLGHGMAPSHPVSQGMRYMAEQVDSLSGGQMEVEIYPSEQLGTERQCLELLQIGSLDMAKVSSAVLEGFSHDYRVFGLPYVFRDDEHRFNVLEGEIGREILMSGRDVWLRGLTYYDAGSRSFYTAETPVRTPEDLEGLKIRVQQSPVAIQMVQALGAQATPISFGELYTALQQGGKQPPEPPLDPPLRARRLLLARPAHRPAGRAARKHPHLGAPLRAGARVVADRRRPVAPAPENTLGRGGG
jgi:tripartite ATP-independent transporter DctP family solute receptor